MFNVTGTGLSAQVNESDTMRQAIRITYSITPSSKNPNAINKLPYNEYVEIYCYPYVMHVLGTFQDHGGYFITDTKSNLTFYCLPDESGIAFFPSFAGNRSCDCHKPVISKRQDTIAGYIAHENLLLMGIDTMRFWTSSDFDFTFPEYDEIEGIVLAKDYRMTTGLFNVIATNIDTIHLHRKYYSPELYNSPITFESDAASFQKVARLISGVPPKFKTGMRERTVAARKPYSPFEAHSTFEINNLISFLEGNLFNANLKLDWEEFTEATFIIVVDYELLKPVPAFLIQYLQEVDTNFSGINTIILTRSKARLVKKAIRKNPTLRSIPHYIIANDNYTRFKWEEPLSYVLVDKQFKIKFLESAFDVHSTKVLDNAIKQLLPE